MNDERWHAVDRLFERALEQPSARRLAWLEVACPDDEFLRREAASLIEAHDSAGSFLDNSAHLRAAIPPAVEAAPRAGHRIEQYEIGERLGEGGMGAVYRAIDHRLGRDVAMKFLPPDFTTDEEWLRRFHDEARLAGSLNHANVVAIHDIGSSVFGPYLVSELLNGETLRARLVRGAIGVRRAVEIAIGIARGLAAAHERRIVHRDLKPENVFLTRDGQIKILDFGIAKRITPQSSPIGSSQFDTMPGVLFGTVAYLSPEQIGGRSADPRSDLYALGVVLYEMIAGRRPFSRATSDETMQAILHDEAASFGVATGVPLELERLVWCCLAKEPSQRFQSAGDLAMTLESLAAGRFLASRSIASSRTFPSRIAWMASITALLIAVAAAAAFMRSPQRPAPMPITFELAPPVGTTFASAPVLSPDGSSIAFVAHGDEGRFLFVRTLATLAVRKVAGTDDGMMPFWSPDGQSLGFFADGKLKRVGVAQGLTVVLAPAPGARGGTWTVGGTIVYSPFVGDGLFAVSQDGGKPWRITTVNLARGDNSHRWPAALPDGKHVLFLARNDAADQSGIYITATTPTADAPILLVLANSNAIMTSSTSGAPSLLFVQGGSLMVKGFDVERRTIVGNAEVVAGTVGDASPESPAAFSASQTGVLAYSPWAGPRHQLTYEDIHGQTIGSFGDPGVYMHPRFSPDGREVAVSRLDDSTGRVDVWVLSTITNRARRLTSQPRFSAAPAWSPDGRRIAYMARSAAGKDDFDIFVRSADGTGPEMCLVCAPDTQTGAEWTPDGRFVLYESVSPGSVAIWAMRTEPGHDPVPLLAARFATLGPRVSPDGHWLAYMSDESGKREVYVREFRSDGDVPRVGAAWLVSAAGGRDPRWRPDGHALYYVAPDRHLMTASVGSGRTRFSGAPTRSVLSFDAVPGGPSPTPFAYYDVSGGDGRIVDLRRIATTATPSTVVIGWTAPVVKSTRSPEQ